MNTNKHKNRNEKSSLICFWMEYFILLEVNRFILGWTFPLERKDPRKEREMIASKEKRARVWRMFKADIFVILPKKYWKKEPQLQRKKVLLEYRTTALKRMITYPKNRKGRKRKTFVESNIDKCEFATKRTTF